MHTVTTAAMLQVTTIQVTPSSVCVHALIGLLLHSSCSANLVRPDADVADVERISDALRVADEGACLTNRSYELGRAATPPYSAVQKWARMCDERGRPWQDWRWKAANTQQCSGIVELVHGVDVCRALRNTSVLVVGDSLSYQMYASMVQRVGDAAHSLLECEAGMHNHTSAAVLCSGSGQSLAHGSTTLSYLRNDELAERSTGDASERCTTHCQDFWRKARGFDVLVFNRGAHYHDDTTVVNQTKRFAVRLKEHLGPSPAQIIFWRTTQPGHENCTDVTRPLSTREVQGYNRTWGLQHNWGDFGHQNNLITEVLAVALPGVATVIDAFWSGLARADRHHGAHDCLHYCLPGPPDWWVNLFAFNLQHLRHRQRIKRYSTTANVSANAFKLRHQRHTARGAQARAVAFNNPAQAAQAAGAVAFNDPTHQQTNTVQRSQAVLIAHSASPKPPPPPPQPRVFEPCAAKRCALLYFHVPKTGGGSINMLVQKHMQVKYISVRQKEYWAPAMACVASFLTSVQDPDGAGANCCQRDKTRGWRAGENVWQKTAHRLWLLDVR